MPFKSEIISFNSHLDNSPELVNSDPYGKGWMIRVKIIDPSDIDSLLTSDDYKELIL